VPALPSRPLRAAVCHLLLARRSLALPVSLLTLPLLPSRLINARLRARKSSSPPELGRAGFRIHRLRHRGQNRHQPWLELRISNSGE
jgi:hypothetical protein